MAMQGKATSKFLGGLAAVGALLFAGLALAQSTPTSVQTPPAETFIPAPGAADSCARPNPPRYPRAGQQLTLEQLNWTRDQRDRFITASDVYLRCLDQEIESRMRSMMTTNADDPRVNAAGADHQNASAAKFEAIKQFALLCYDYEGRSGVAYTPGCLPTMGR
jgi:Spy/CpxP family protein refolding chaperone